MQTNVKKDITILLSISFLSAILYIAFEGTLMEFGRNEANPLWLRFLPVLLIQMGMSCVGPFVILWKNKEAFSIHGFIRKNVGISILGCLLVSIPTIVFLYGTNELNGFLPFQGMFLTLPILASGFPWNVLGYMIIALVWGFGEGFFYVLLADKINQLRKPKRYWNPGAFLCAVIALLMHGMIGFDLLTILEGLATFILMYGSLCIREKTGNAWGNILLFFVIWNAL